LQLLSHGQRKLDDHLLRLMVREFHLSAAELLRFVECEMSYQDYLRRMIDGGVALCEHTCGPVGPNSLDHSRIGGRSFSGQDPSHFTGRNSNNGKIADLPYPELE